MIKVKICGITNLEDAKFASMTGADALGFIFTKKSPRYVSEKKAKKIMESLDPYVVKVGVFLNQPQPEVLAIAQSLGLDALQFHGTETPAYCNFFKSKYRVVKVLFPSDAPYKTKISRYKADAFMFDVLYEDKTKGKKCLSQKTLKELAALIKREARVIISGGLDVKNIDKIVKLKPYGVDVTSGVEAMAGKKDKDLVAQFIAKVKNIKSATSCRFQASG